jgi:hypothetical protein
MGAPRIVIQSGVKTASHSPNIDKAKYNHDPAAFEQKVSEKLKKLVEDGEDYTSRFSVERQPFMEMKSFAAYRSNYESNNFIS